MLLATGNPLRAGDAASAPVPLWVLMDDLLLARALCAHKRM
jgi:hypothetical protein